MDSEILDRKSTFVRNLAVAATLLVLGNTVETVPENHVNQPATVHQCSTTQSKNLN